MGKVFKDAQAVRDCIAEQFTIATRDICRYYRANKPRIVTTNGCYEVIHEGHKEMLKTASKMGDMLFVGVNCDKRVQELKARKPLHNEQERVKAISEVEGVTGAFIFYEDTPIEFCEIIRPDIHCKGGDYAKAMPETPIVEKHGGRVELIPFKTDVSTTDILEGK